MKKISILIATIFLIISCGSKKDNTESFYIPKNVVGLTYINIKSLSEKSNDLDFKKLNFNKFIQDNAPSDIKLLLNDLMTTENINKTFRKEFVFGFGSIKRMSGFGGLVLPIKDADAFENFIQPIVEELPKLEKEERVGKNEAFTIYSTDEIAIGWNEKTALIIASKNHAAAELKDLTSLEKEKSVITTDYFDTFFNPKKDMGLYISTSTLGSTLSGLITMGTGMDLDIENNSLTYYGNFEDDHIHTISNLKLNDDLKSLLGYENWMGTSFENNLLDFIPEDVLILAKLSVKPDEIDNHIKSLQTNKILSTSVREELTKEYENINTEMKKETGINFKEFANIFNGSLIFGMSEGITVKDTVYEYNYLNYNNDKRTYTIVDKKIPYMYGAIAIEDKDGFDKLFNKILEEEGDIQKISENYYQLNEDTQMVYNDDVIFITNDLEKALEVSKDGEIDNNLSGFKHKSKLSHTFYMFSKGNISSLSNTLAGIANPYSRYSRASTMDDVSEKNAEIYDKYFGENHYYMDLDGSETYTYTKGNENSLVQSILYADELAKVLADETTKNSAPYINEDTEDEEDVMEEIEEAVIESTETN